MDVFVTSPSKSTPTPAPAPAASTLTRREIAWNTVKEEEGLSPYSLAKARTVFRKGEDVVEEYLSFDSKDEAEREVRSFWLNNEMPK